MSNEEDPCVMEAIWDDPCQNGDVVPVHQWQKDILDERERLVEQGEAEFVDWETAKKRIAERIS